mgnify:CR=1 FL=1
MRHILVRSYYQEVYRGYRLKYIIDIIPFYLLGIWIGSSYSIIGVAVAVTFVRTVFGLASFWIVANLLKTTFFTIIKQLKTPFISSLIMSLSCLILDKLVLILN